MKKKQKETQKLNTQSDNSYTRLRVLFLILGIASSALFLYFVYLFVSNSRQLSASQDVVSDQIILANKIEKQYASVSKGMPSNSFEKSIAQFDSQLKSLETGQEGVSQPTPEQRSDIKKASSEWQSLKGIFSDELSKQSTAKQSSKNMTDISVMLSNIKLSARRLESDLNSSENVTRIAKNLNKIVNLTNSMDKNINSLLSEGFSLANYNKDIKNHSEMLTEAFDNVNKDTQTLGDNVYRDITNSKKLQADTHDQIKLIKEKVSSLNALIEKVSSEGNMSTESIDIRPNMTALSAQLQTLKASYTKGNNHPFAAVPLSYLGWVVFWLIAAILLLTIWATMVIKNASHVNKEATRLRFAAEERTQSDQEAILRLMDDLGDLSEGDLTIEAQVTEDFTGAIADSINFTVENMRDMVGTITHTSDEITRATALSTDVSSLLSDSSTEQSKQIDTSATTVREMSSSLREIAESTDSSVEIARSSVDMAQEGRNRVHSTIKSMIDIRENIQETAKRIKRLGESSQEIGDIVEIIKDIADQTNVLALNAAIQATAAGEAGRGFAVVADEVQRLAERSANATKRIELLVKTIQTDANEAVSSMENSTKQVVTGADVAEQAGQSLDKIEDVSKNLANLIVNVSQATREAAGMAGSIAFNMDSLAKLNEKTVQDVTTSVKSVDDLRELSASLKNSVAGFKLPE